MALKANEIKVPKCLCMLYDKKIELNLFILDFTVEIIEIDNQMFFLFANFENNLAN